MLHKKRRVKGGEIYSLESGSGFPLLLLPSAAGRAVEYQDIIPLLEDRFRVYAIDYPGFGQSEDIPGISSLSHLTDFVLDWMDTAGLEQCHILGFSMGGWMALSLALGHPHRISRLILVATAAGMLPGIPMINPSGLNYKEILERFYYRPELKETLAGKRLSPSEKKEIHRSSKTFSRLCRGKQLVPALHHRLHEIAHPTLIIGAEKDQAIPLAYQKRLHSDIPKSTLRVFKETGHAIIAEQPEALFIEISSFLQ